MPEPQSGPGLIYSRSILRSPHSQPQLFSCFLLAYPLALPLPHLSSPRARHIYNVAVSTFFFVGLLRLYFGFAQLVATSALTYWMVANRVGGKKMPWIVFVTQMGHLLCK